MQPFDFDEVIDIDGRSLLLIKRGKHEDIGPCIEITQIWNGNGKVVEGGKMHFPLTQSTPTALKALLEWAENRIASMTPAERLNLFVEKALDDSRQSKTPLPIRREPYKGVEVTPDRLKESVPNSTFNLEDIVFALQNNKPFSQKIHLGKLSPLNDLFFDLLRIHLIRQVGHDFLQPLGLILIASELFLKDNLSQNFGFILQP